MTQVQRAAKRLIEIHGGVRAAARAKQLDPAYLVRLRDGAKTNPTGAVLEKLGLVKEVTYKRRRE